METKLNKPRKFSVMLKENDTNSCSYKIDRKLYDTLKKYLEPFRSFQAQPKKIKCIETGQIFRCANDANLYLVDNGISHSYGGFNAIKEVCKGRKKTAYGHYEFVKEQI